MNFLNSLGAWHSERMSNLITKAKIIEQPYSGQYEEKVYDVPHQGSSLHWTWIKFEDDNYHEWCGQFRGAQRAVALSSKYNLILLATSDYLFQIDCIRNKVTAFESSDDTQKQYQDLTVTPFGDFILADYFHIEKISDSIHKRELINSPMAMDMITFNRWTENKLLISCQELGVVDSKIELEFDATSDELTIVSRKYNY